ncbi:MAG TPA: hypothetical protein EYN79_01255 [Planctomycetes bacterium]|nr:hypothetical protein [Planctomycetota bacterium]HIN79873.1 hypothetical protein [Planctomycetota bacterium]HIO65432.1 hypothetical protein [Planctomycetota bacterium]
MNASAFPRGVLLFICLFMAALLPGGKAEAQSIFWFECDLTGCAPGEVGIGWIINSQCHPPISDDYLVNLYEGDGTTWTLIAIGTSNWLNDCFPIDLLSTEVKIEVLDTCATSSVVVSSSVCSLSVQIPPPPPSPPANFYRGDGNLDGSLDMADVIMILYNVSSGSPALDCKDAGDTNDDGVLDIADPIFLIQFLFSDGQPIPDPLDPCGVDPTIDGLDCLSGC